MQLAAFSPNGALLAVGAALSAEADAEDRPESRAVDVWDLRTGALVRTLDAGLPRLAALSWSPDGRFLATAADPHTGAGEIRLWDVGTWALLAQRGTYCFGALSWSPDSTWFAAAGCHMSLSVVKTSGATWDRTPSMKDGDGAAAQSTPIAASRDAKRLLYAVQDGRYESWDITAPVPLRVHAARTLRWSAFGSSPDGARFAVSSSEYVDKADEGSIDVHDAATGARLRRLRTKTIDDQVEWLGFAANGDIVASYGSGRIVSWNGGTGVLRATIVAPPKAPAWSAGLQMSPDGARLVVLDGDGACAMWELAGSTRGAILHPAARPLVPAEYRAWAQFSFSSDGSRLVEVRSDGVVELFDAVIGTRRTGWKSDAGGAPSVALRRDGKVLALVGDHVRLVRSDGDEALTLASFVDGARRVALAYAADGAYAGADEAVACVEGMGPPRARSSLVPDFVARAEAAK